MATTVNRREFLGALGFSAASLLTLRSTFWRGCPVSPELYSINGQTIFPVYAADGGLSASVRSYLILREGENVYSFGFDPREMPEAEARKSFTQELDLHKAA
jgi:hypothetical protein